MRWRPTYATSGRTSTRSTIGRPRRSPRRRRWRLSDALALKSLTNYRDYEAEFYQDFDVSEYPGCRQPLVGPSSTCTLPAGIPRTAGNHWQPLYQHQWSEELQLAYEGNRLHGLLAAYYLQEFIRIQNHLGYNPNPHFSSDPADVRAIFDGNMNVETWAVFGNATYDLSDRFSFKAGARYSSEKRDVTSYQATAIPPAPAPVPSAVGYPWVREKDWDNFSPQLGIEFRPTDGLMTYFTWAKGFKSGTAVIGEAGKEFVDPEKVTSYEAGLKSRLLDNRLQLNLAAFYHEVEDAQFQFTFPLATPPNFTTQMRNAAQIEAKGVELEVAWRVDTGLHGRCLRGLAGFGVHVVPGAEPVECGRICQHRSDDRVAGGPERQSHAHVAGVELQRASRLRDPARQRGFTGPGGQRRLQGQTVPLGVQ